MTRHTYRALNARGEIIRGATDAADITELEARLRRRGLELINAEARIYDTLLTALRGRIPRRELIHFCFHLEQLLAAGVPIIDALTDLREATAHARTQQIVARLLEDIEGGLPLSEAATRHPDAFDEVFCSLLQAGEQTGTLAPVLNQLAQALEREHELVAHARKLAIYPIIVSAVLLAAAIVALLFVVPELARLFRSTGQSLPLQTRILIDLSNVVSDHGALMITLLPFIGVGLGLAYRRSAAFRFRLDLLRLRLPVLGPLQYKIAMARIAGLIAMLYASGITILEALRTAVNASGNLAIRDSLCEAERRIVEGHGIAAAFEVTGLFPQLVTRMLRIGEQTGGMDAALGNIASFYARDTRESIERLQASAEPLLTLILGAFMLWIVFAVLGPVYDILTRLPL
ncbi:type II secretion system F family protein [Azoarcus sp. L1K30]|uniref:type II secretion system F family protein n=1 Tax=Azoarcus sp. L1K30 TaxID=2820277 RepID=UPI001B842C87|nr:type II secretion system F family protein [Azoarcus sp. L1K30]MBR0568308.1 type II secretion system F family protein [Azoarcus sp. L1K30]